MLSVPKKLAVAGSSFIDSVFKNWGKASPIEPQDVDQAEYFWYLDSSRAEEELGFRPARPAGNSSGHYQIRPLQTSLGGGVFS